MKVIPHWTNIISLTFQLTLFKKVVRFYYFISFMHESVLSSDDEISPMFY